MSSKARGAAAIRFFGETLGLEAAFDAGKHRGTGGPERRQGPAIRPRHRYFAFYRNHGARIIPLLEVDDLDQASAELARGGAEQPVTVLMLVPDQSARCRGYGIMVFGVTREGIAAITGFPSPACSRDSACL